MAKEWLRYIFWVVIGAALGAIFTTHLFLNSAQKDIARQRESLRSEKQAMDTINESAKKILAQRDACWARFNKATVLIERQASDRGVSPNPLAGARWFIPAEVKPTYYGEAASALYYQIENGNKLVGPFLPEVDRSPQK